MYIVYLLAFKASMRKISRRISTPLSVEDNPEIRYSRKGLSCLHQKLWPCLLSLNQTDFHLEIYCTFCAEVGPSSCISRLWCVGQPFKPDLSVIYACHLHSLFTKIWSFIFIWSLLLCWFSSIHTPLHHHPGKHFITWDEYIWQKHAN